MTSLTNPSSVVSDWWGSASFSPKLIRSILEWKLFLNSVSSLCCLQDGRCFFFLSLFFFLFIFFLASSSDMASLDGSVSPSESFHPHQGSRAVTTGIRLITHSPRRVHTQEILREAWPYFQCIFIASHLLAPRANANAQISSRSALRIDKRLRLLQVPACTLSFRLFCLYTGEHGFM